MDGNRQEIFLTTFYGRVIRIVDRVEEGHDSPINEGCLTIERYLSL